MKQLFVLITALLANIAFAADWTYDSSAGTISDGDWTFAATVNGTDLTVGAVQSDPGADATLDFSKSITDGSTEYTLVRLNPNFSGYANKANLKTLVLPTEGLTEISANAFKSCAALTNIVNYIPDSVTTLGASAFQSVPAKQHLRIASVATINSATFNSSGITSVYFGPALKSIWGSWGGGAFASCASLTNLVFDPGISDASFTGYEQHFASCTKLEGTIDLSGFSSIKPGTNGTTCPFPGCTKITGIIFGEGLTKLGVGTINGLTGLKTITFKGPPPTFYTSPSVAGTGNFFNNIANDKMITTYVQEEYAEAWSAYAKDGVINHMSSCWATPWAVAAAQSNRPLIYKKSGGGGELGEWVFDSNTSVVTNGEWKFSATSGGAMLTVDSCLQAPAAVSKLDFSLSVTDEEGHEMMFVGLNTGFGSNSACATKVGELVLTNTISSISANAFNGCTALTNIVEYLPDSVMTLGDGAFKSVPAKQHLRLRNVATIKGSSFNHSGVTSVYFGPALKQIWGGYGGGAFGDCVNLTNLVFDAAISGASFQGSEQHFINCTKLVGTVDLSVFSSVKIGTNATGSPFIGCTKIEKFILGEGLVELGMGAFNIGNNSSLRTVEFRGPAPKFYSTPSALTDEPKLYGTMGMVTTLVYKAWRDVPVADGFKTWRQYVEGPVFNYRHGAWTNTCISSGVAQSNRPLFCVDSIPGLKVVIR